MIAGIAVAAAALVIAIVGFFIWRSRRNSSPPPPADPTDFNAPRVDPYQHANPASGYHPNHGGPSMTEFAPVGAVAAQSAYASSSSNRDSAFSYPSSGQALLEAQRTERKMDPSNAAAYHTRPLLPGTPGSPDRTSYTGPSSASANYPAGGFAVANPETSPWDQQEAAARRTASPPLPPGAAMPSPMQALAQPGAFLGRSNTTASAMERQDPPPQYSPNQ